MDKIYLDLTQILIKVPLVPWSSGFGLYRPREDPKGLQSKTLGSSCVVLLIHGCKLEIWMLRSEPKRPPGDVMSVLFSSRSGNPAIWKYITENVCACGITCHWPHGQWLYLMFIKILPCEKSLPSPGMPEIALKLDPSWEIFQCRFESGKGWKAAVPIALQSGLAWRIGSYLSYPLVFLEFFFPPHVSYVI